MCTVVQVLQVVKLTVEVCRRDATLTGRCCYRQSTTAAIKPAFENSRSLGTIANEYISYMLGTEVAGTPTSMYYGQ